IALQALLHDQGKDLRGTRVAIQGFGNVGSWAARLLAQAGARVVAISDVTGGVRNPEGLDVTSLLAWVEAQRGVQGFPGGEGFPAQDLLVQPCDVLIPAALEGVLTAENAPHVRAKV